jgi:hypothetical protein
MGKGAQRRAHQLAPLMGTLRFAHPTHYPSAVGACLQAILGAMSNRKYSPGRFLLLQNLHFRRPWRSQAGSYRVVSINLSSSDP